MGKIILYIFTPFRQNRRIFSYQICNYNKKCYKLLKKVLYGSVLYNKISKEPLETKKVVT